MKTITLYKEDFTVRGWREVLRAVTAAEDYRELAEATTEVDITIHNYKLVTDGGGAVLAQKQATKI